MAPEFDSSKELREHMTEADGDIEENLPMDNDTVAAEVLRRWINRRLSKRITSRVYGRSLSW